MITCWNRRLPVHAAHLLLEVDEEEEEREGEEAEGERIEGHTSEEYNKQRRQKVEGSTAKSNGRGFHTGRQSRIPEVPRR